MRQTWPEDTRGKKKNDPPLFSLKAQTGGGGIRKPIKQNRKKCFFFCFCSFFSKSQPALLFLIATWWRVWLRFFFVSATPAWPVLFVKTGWCVSVMVSRFPVYCCGGITVGIFPFGRGVLALSLRSIWRRKQGRANMIPTRVSDQRGTGDNLCTAVGSRPIPPYRILLPSLRSYIS